ncbi:hypothetical protein HDU97_004030 [Phlyctochytrium planicorne]|nr:hypothetical protein HDU97_004030 [Phlyctochytrium planicorne]
MVDESIVWRRYGELVKSAPPKPTARKYRTWKSVVMKDWDHVCERCFKYVDLRSIYKSFLPVPADVLDSNVRKICSGCRRDLHKALMEESSRLERVAAAERAQRVEERRRNMVTALNAKGDLNNIVMIMEEMAWYFRATRYNSLRLVAYTESYRSYGGRSRWYDSDDEDGRSCGGSDDYDYDYEPRMRTRVDSELGKSRALEEWATNRLKAGNFRSPRLDNPGRERPPESLWDRLDGIMREQIQQKYPGSQLHVVEETGQEGAPLIDLSAMELA